MINNENNKVMKETFKFDSGLHFWCEAIPISKQSKNYVKRQISQKILKERITSDNYLKNRTYDFYEGYLYIKIVFSLYTKRLSNRRNDIDNLIKHTLDCLKGILFKDDSQIKKISAVKYSVDKLNAEGTGIVIDKFRDEIEN